MSFAALKDVIVHLLEPWILMSISFRHIPQTISSIVSSGDLWKLFSYNAFTEALFGHFWVTVGPEVKELGEEYVIPLLEGRLADGKIHDRVVDSAVHGTIVEVGAGTGMWADVFARIAAGADADSSTDGTARKRKPTGPSSITKIYGVEPNAQCAELLKERVREVGLTDLYEVVPVGIESLSDPNAWSGQIQPGSVDCIVTVMCLCSIPEPEKNIQHLYKLLKPGGHWYVYEHVKTTRGGPLLALYQRLVSIPWRLFLGSCRICRDTKTSLVTAGPWRKVDLTHLPSEPPYEVLPHVLGTLTK
ncbi:phospholipid methyltransferase [Drechmeria coniospora]|uniref:Phospholipid methyltransferase n=1 Tax=Drechmeria coniospora TaxID=98403 RepID=A0A151GTP8_DRECN|nr:phospholipid methyltransferase [Drechmeria coniospora]KYK60496.1 phospholipid methyltransferase [Drechmeria coniospora]ODA80652.1 hypothetical protein RJ55_03611 [Drechmeria coniospora]